MSIHDRQPELLRPAANAWDRSHAPTSHRLINLESRSLFVPFVERNPNPVLVLDWVANDPLRCPAVYVNDEFKRLVGFSLDNFTAGECHFVDELYAHPTVHKRAVHAINHGKPDGVDAAAHGLWGGLVKFAASLIPIGEVGNGFLAIQLQDITNLKDMAENGVAAGADIKSILAGARCLVWYALVDDHAGQLDWDIHAQEEEAVGRRLLIDLLPGESFFQAYTRLIPQEDIERIDGIAERALRNDDPHYGQEYRLNLANGECRWMSETVQIERLTDYRWRLIGVVTDITDTKAAQEQVAEERNLLRTLIDNIPDGIFYKDTSNRIIINNSNYARMIGQITPDKMAGMGEYDLLPDDVAAFIQKEELEVIETGIPLINQEQPVTLPNGRRIWYASTRVPLHDASGKIVGLLGISRNITAQKQFAAERERLLADAVDRADHDPLTGLLNHRSFHKLLKDEADLARVRGNSLAVMLIDLSNFKFFNDSYGHTVGDEVLRNVAAALLGVRRANDIVARFGGDEFALIMPVANECDAGERAHHIAEALDNLGYQPAGYATVVPIRCSFGIAVYPGEAGDGQEALSLADARLIRMKSGIGEAGDLAEQLRAEVATTGKGFEMLFALVNSVDNKDRYTRRHSEDVLLYAYRIARAIGLDEAACREIKIAALLHDIGKIGIADSILRKPASLTNEEFEAVKLHPTMGAIIVGAVPGFEAMLPAIKHHHERWDGRGYPDGLKGEETAPMARLLAVADAFSAMTTDRPYRKGMTRQVAEQILREGAGTQWDAELVHAFLEG